MLRGILGRLAGGRRRTTGTGMGTGRRPVGGTGGTANRDIEQGARSLFRGLSRKRRL